MADPNAIALWSWDAGRADSEQAKWRVYGPEVTAKLNAAYQTDGEQASISFSISGNDYVVSHKKRYGGWGQHQVNAESRYAPAS